MPRRKQDVAPEVALQRVIRGLEDAPNDDAFSKRHLQPIRDLVLGGPLLVNDQFQQALKQPQPEAGLWRAEFLQFVRTLVRTADQTWQGHPLVTDGRFKFSTVAVGDRVYCHVDSQSIRDVALLHLMLRLQDVGLRNIRQCAAPECQRLFVKTYRREFCSLRCQQRQNKRVQRARQDDERHKHQQMKRRRVARA